MKNKIFLSLSLFALLAQGAKAAKTQNQAQNGRPQLQKGNMISAPQNKGLPLQGALQAGIPSSKRGQMHPAHALKDRMREIKGGQVQAENTMQAGVPATQQGQMQTADSQKPLKGGEVVQPFQPAGVSTQEVVNPNVQQNQGQLVVLDDPAAAQQQTVVDQPAASEEHIDAASDQGANVLEQTALPQQPGDEQKSPLELAAEGKQIISDTEQEASPDEKNLAAMISQNINTDQIVDEGSEAVTAKVEVPVQDVQEAHAEAAATEGQTPGVVADAAGAAQNDQQQGIVDPAQTQESPQTEEQKAADVENSTDVLMNGLQGSPEDQAEFKEMIKQLAVGFTEGLEEEKANEVLAENNVPEAARSAIIIAAHNLSADIARKKVSSEVVEQAVDTDPAAAADQSQGNAVATETTAENAEQVVAQ
jgi:hypothetical protein